MEKIVLTILTVCTIVCAVNWLKWKVSTHAVLLYFARKGYQEPDLNDLEYKKCIEYAAKRIIMWWVK